MARFALRLVVATCAVVALGVTHPARADDELRTGRFVALTYNVAGLTEGLSGSEPATNSPLISPLLNDYDLVLLQENWADVAHDQREAGLVGEEVPRTGYYDLVVADADHPYRSEPVRNPPPPAVHRFPTGPALTSDGLNRLSRYPFDAIERVMWDECNGELAITVVEEVSKGVGTHDALEAAGLGVVNDNLRGGATDCSAHKGFSVATTQLAPGVEVDIYNLHGEAGNAEPDRQASRAGYAQLAAYINQRSTGRAIIFGGDTNLHTDVPAKRPEWAWGNEVWADFLAVTGLHDVCETVDCGEDAGMIDKFAFRSSAAVRLIAESHAFERDKFTRPTDGEPLSDHEALAVGFRWVRTGR